MVGMGRPRDIPEKVGYFRGFQKNIVRVGGKSRGMKGVMSGISKK